MYICIANSSVSIETQTQNWVVKICNVQKALGSMVSIGGLFYPLRYVNFQGENVSGRECNIPGKNKARPTTLWFLPSKLMEMNMFRNLVGNFTTICEVSPTSDVFILGYTIGSKAPPS